MSQATDLVAIETLKPAEVFAPGGVEKLLGEVTTKVRAIKVDASTDGGRTEIKSVAYKIARSKTALDEMGKTFVAELKRAAGVVDADRRTIRDRLDALRDEVRKPVDEWEAAEEARVASLTAGIDELAVLGQFDIGAEFDVETIDQRQAVLETARTRDWQEFTERAEQLFVKIPPVLAARREAAVKREADLIELERLRKAEADRLEAQRLEMAAKAQRQRDEEIAAAAAAKAQRDSEAAIATAERAREEAEARAKAAAQRAEDDRQAAAEKAERDWEAAIEAERKRVADAKAAEDAATAAREADRSHKAKVNNAAVAALMGAAALNEDQAKAVVKAIACGKVSNVSISY